jgi:hypothetical protein
MRRLRDEPAFYLERRASPPSDSNRKPLHYK